MVLGRNKTPLPTCFHGFLPIQAFTNSHNYLFTCLDRYYSNFIDLNGEKKKTLMEIINKKDTVTFNSRNPSFPDL